MKLLELGSLVRMKDEPYQVLGMIIAIEDLLRSTDMTYKIEWFCDLCDVTYANRGSLEVLC